MSKTLKEHSREAWNGDNPTPTVEQLTLGCQQRIADATEKMASNYIRMENDLAYYKRRVLGTDKEKATLQRRVNALRGVITRMKNKDNKK